MDQHDSHDQPPPAAPARHLSAWARIAAARATASWVPTQDSPDA